MSCSVCLSVCLFVCLTDYLSICLSIRPSVCLPPAAAFHPYCQQGFGNNFRRKYTQSRVICQSVVVKVASHVCKFGLFAPVVLHIVTHVCKSWVSAPVVGFTGADPALLLPSSLYFIVMGADHGFLPPSYDSRVRIRPFCPCRLSCMLSRTATRARSAQGASQAEFLREGIFRCRAGVGGQGKLCGDGKPAGPDMPP